MHINKLHVNLLVEVTIDDMVFVLINIYNTNTELEKPETHMFSKYSRQSKIYSKQNYSF